MTTDRSHTDALMASLIEGNVVFLAKATTPTGQRPEPADEAFLAQCMAANYAGAAARLLAFLAEHAPVVVDEAAELVFDAMEDGESIADWVGDEADRRGIDIEAIISRVHARPVTA